MTLVKKPRYIIEDKCRGCTTCVECCPVSYPDPFNQEISTNKAVHIYYSQAIPLVAYIDENCLYLKDKKCRECEAVCENKAIDFSQAEEKINLSVGAIILAAGIEPFDPSIREDYSYGRIPNVVTSMDYERLLCATGPYEGEILRASDKQHPKKIAWIQCVGSRQVIPGGNSYCSSVCCTYTQKQVIVTKEHDMDVECTIFHNDVRSHGKDFERYYERTKNLPGVRFIRSYVSLGRELSENGNVTIRYSTTDEGVREEKFDMVVLSVGLNPPADYTELSRVFDVELDSHGFCATDPVNPIETSRRGIYLSGGFQGPVDIPESVYSASGAASVSSELLDYRRGKLHTERIYPEERDVSGEGPRIGVFVCHCGANIGRVVDVPSVVEYTQSLPGVVYAQEQLFSCATNCTQEIADIIQEKGLNRVVVAACSPRTLEPLFRDTLREAGINPYYFEFANIREHCSWVHSREKEEATRKAKDITRMSVARAGFLEPLQEFDLPVTKTALVIGGGLAGMTCALSVAEQHYEAHLLERESELGGIARRIHTTLEGPDVQEFLNGVVQKVYRNPLVHIYTKAEIRETTGYIGNFVTVVDSDRGITEIKHGATVVATGAEVYTPTEYLYGQNEKVLTHLELEEKITAKDERLINANSLVMIQCVGCRNEDRNYCSRVCCSESIKNALRLKEINPEIDINILYRDMRTYGLKEDYYREAADKEIRFIRYEPENPPQVENVNEDGRDILRISVPDPVLNKMIAMDADYLALAAAVIPAAGTEELAEMFRLTLNPDGFFKEAHVKLRPVEFATDGIYLCGMAQYPKHIIETLSQAYGAAGRVLTLLSKDTITASGSVCEVDESRCIGCGVCSTACTYDAIVMRETKRGLKAAVNPVLCKGDGLCNAKCPTGAISLKHYTNEELRSQIDTAFTDEMVSKT
ncbi:MAG: CoB--CoM heterodisulfide reductase iron-sulfur subunit A family protein [Dehalococcoidales bacterium]|nr:MAG: CoB--CoM heterodisulfide reductase iron-sulfur subunit A family protein [Dehalococcoidales bacterium]